MIPELIEPLFRCVPLTYRDYHFLGAPKIVFWIWAPILGVSFLALDGTLPAEVALPAAVAITFAAVTWAEWRWRTRVAYRPGDDEQSRRGCPPRSDASPIANLPTALAILIGATAACRRLFGGFGTYVAYGALVGLILVLECAEIVEAGAGSDPEGGASSGLRRASGAMRVSALCLAGFLGVLAARCTWLSSVTAQVGLWFLAFLEPRLRLRSVVEKVAAQVRRARDASDQHPHLIAHSFGTVIIRHVLGASPGLAINKLLLVGCVLREDFDWTPLVNRENVIIDDIRNECGGQDFVVNWCAYFVGRAFRWTRLGRAGSRGFSCSSGAPVHQIGGPLASCGACERGRRGCRIHNVPLEEYGHNDWFLNTDHVRDLWLPHLWDMAAGEYLDFLELCRKGALAVRSKDWGTYNVVDLELRERRWEWASHDATGAVLSDCIADDLRFAWPERAASPEQARRLAIELESPVVAAMVLEVAKACVEFEKSGNRDWDLIQWSLNPRRAITRAVNREIARRTRG